jgi:hypothetical protein
VDLKVRIETRRSFVQKSWSLQATQFKFTTTCSALFGAYPYDTNLLQPLQICTQRRWLLHPHLGPYILFRCKCGPKSLLSEESPDLDYLPSTTCVSGNQSNSRAIVCLDFHSKQQCVREDKRVDISGRVAISRARASRILSVIAQDADEWASFKFQLDHPKY